MSPLLRLTDPEGLTELFVVVAEIEAVTPILQHDVRGKPVVKEGLGIPIGSVLLLKSGSTVSTGQTPEEIFALLRQLM